MCSLLFSFFFVNMYVSPFCQIFYRKNPKERTKGELKFYASRRNPDSTIVQDKLLRTCRYRQEYIATHNATEVLEEFPILKIEHWVNNNLYITIFNYLSCSKVAGVPYIEYFFDDGKLENLLEIGIQKLNQVLPSYMKWVTLSLLLYIYW